MISPTSEGMESATSSPATSSSVKKFHCGSCNHEFSKRSNLTRHRRTVHQESIARGRSAQQCPLCDFQYLARAAYARHLGDAHDTWLTEERYEFESLESFFDWKGEVERSTVSAFVRNTAKKNTRDGIKTYYICCRKGHYKSESKGMKLIKRQGSRKINSSCPAAMTVLETSTPSGTTMVRVSFVSTHVGHDNELAHLGLTKSEREQVAHQISLGFSAERILKNFCQGAAVSEVERIRLLKKRDIRNIARDFKLDIRKHEIDLSVLESWAGQLEQGGRSSLLLYKPQGTVDGRHEELRDDDFVLGLMNDTQEALMTRHSRQLVCMDHIACGSGASAVRLVSVHVLDEEDGTTAERPRVLPVALMVTGRLDRAVVLAFLRCLRQRVGTVATEVLVSGGQCGEGDVEDKCCEAEDIFYDAWCETMGVPQNRWMCGWHVMACWVGHLKGMPKDVARNARRKMETLVRERDQRNFEKALPKALEDLANCRVTTEFAWYLDTRWSPLSRRWAHCYRVGILSGNASGAALSQELMHKEMSLHFGSATNGGGVCRRRSAPPALDAALLAVLRYVREVLLGSSDHQVLLHMAPLLEQFQVACTVRHSRCEEVATDSRLRLSRGTGGLQWLVEEQDAANENTWQVYEVKFLDGGETDFNCSLACSSCHVCVHTLSCTCLDYAVGFNACVHLHAVAMAAVKVVEESPPVQIPAESKTETDEMYMDVDEAITTATTVDVSTTEEIGDVIMVKTVEAVQAAAIPGAGVDTEQFFRLQEEVIGSMNELLEECETVPQLEALRRMLEPVRPVLAVLRGSDTATAVAVAPEHQPKRYVVLVNADDHDMKDDAK